MLFHDEAFRVVEWRYEGDQRLTVERYADYDEAQARADGLNASIDPGDHNWLAYYVAYPEKDTPEGI